MSHHEHQEAAMKRFGTVGVRCGVLTCSDTRTPDDDGSGNRIVDMLEEAGHAIAFRTVTREDPVLIAGSLDDLLGRGIDLLVCTGGTGISQRDGTIEIVRERLTIELPGFGELFRSLSHEEIGAAAMLSRAMGGVARSPSGSTLLFAPDSTCGGRI